MDKVKIADVTAALESRGYAVEWPVTGRLLLDGQHDLDVERILTLSNSAEHAADAIEERIGRDSDA